LDDRLVLFLDFQSHTRHTLPAEPDRTGGRGRQIDDMPPGAERAAVVDAHDHGFFIAEVRDAHLRAERQGPVRSGEFMNIKTLPVLNPA